MIPGRLKTYNVLFYYLLCAVLFLLACDDNKTVLGYTYIPEMNYSPTIMAYHPIYADSLPGIRQANVVPFTDIPYQFEKSDSARILAGQVIEQPVGDADIVRGKHLYEIYCSNCHGITGNGKGIFYTSGKYPYKPPSLISEKITMIPAGELFHVISVGEGLMGPQAASINNDDRWHIVNYIRVGLTEEE